MSLSHPKFNEPGGSIYRLADRPRSTLSRDEICTLKTLNAMIDDAATKLSDDTTALCDEDFHSLWIGLLLGSDACRDIDSAGAWASAIRYDLADAYGLAY